jgi:translation initiation factor 2B subunit (eIF-2B alpha/beta/delta family)
MTAFSDDRASGSGAVALAFLDALERWTEIDRSASAPALRASLLEWLRAAQASQPSMALVHQLAARALEVADAGVAREDRVAELRIQIVRSCAAEREDLALAAAGAARTAASLVTQRNVWIATLSNSGLVLDALREVRGAGLAPNALVAEGRPLLEGRALAAALAAVGIPAWLTVDAALPMLVAQAAMVWIGADTVTERGVINKVGSFALALAAREHGVPVYALALRRKFLPAAAAALRIEEMPPEEVWDEPADGVRPRNVYFEVVPLALLRGIVVEDAVLTAGEAAGTARDRALPAELGG